MRLISRKPLVLLFGALLLSGCYRPWLYPGYYGNGYGGYGYGQPGYGGYQGYPGIQTLTPGQYYTPGTVDPTFAPNSNSLQPTPDSNSSGTGGDGGNAPASNYNPATKPVPEGQDPTPFYGNNPGGGAGIEAPMEGPVHQEKPELNDAPNPGTSLRKAPAAWNDSGIAPAGHEQTAEQPAEMLAPTVGEPSEEGTAAGQAEPVAEPVSEEPPLFPAPEAP